MKELAKTANEICLVTKLLPIQAIEKQEPFPVRRKIYAPYVFNRGKF